MEDGLTIAQMTEASGTSAHTLRYYEREGLLQAIERNTGGHRRYRSDDLAALTFIGYMRATGMGIAALREYMRLTRIGNATVERRRAMLLAHRERVIARRAELDACLEIIDRKIAIFEEVAGPLHENKGEKKER